jgi:hypothetical protein
MLIPLGFLAASGGVSAVSVEYLVIAGGGGTNFMDTRNYSGGGGAGGYRASIIGENSGGGASAELPLLTPVGQTLTVTIGGGGFASNGSNSVFGSITSIGGGRAGFDNSTAPAVGGSGGGSGEGNQGLKIKGSATANQGFLGGDALRGSDSRISAGGGGGGAGGLGGNGRNNTSSPYGGNGGTHVTSSITGTAINRAGGGGGACAFGGEGGVATGGGGNGGGQGNGSPGTVNTGGGAGGSGAFGDFTNAQQGGSGIVILRYPSAFTITIGSGLTGSTATVGSNKVTTITSGTGNVSWAA